MLNETTSDGKVAEGKIKEEPNRRQYVKSTFLLDSINWNPFAPSKHVQRKNNKTTKQLH